MNEIAQMVSQKFNLSPEVSQQLVDFIVTQVKGKLPEGLSQHVDGLPAGGTEAEGNRIDHWRYNQIRTTLPPGDRRVAAPMLPL